MSKETAKVGKVAAAMTMSIISGLTTAQAQDAHDAIVKQLTVMGFEVEKDYSLVPMNPNMDVPAQLSRLIAFAREKGVNIVIEPTAKAFKFKLTASQVPNPLQSGHHVYSTGQGVPSQALE